MFAFCLSSWGFFIGERRFLEYHSFGQLAALGQIAVQVTAAIICLFVSVEYFFVKVQQSTPLVLCIRCRYGHDLTTMTANCSRGDGCV